MSILKRLSAATFCALLWTGSVPSAELPIPPTTESQAAASDVEQRLNQLQQRLERLEAENGQLKQSLFQSHSGAVSGVTPASAEMWNADAACPPACQCPVCAAEKTGKGEWTTGWNHGIEWVSPDKAFKVHIGGRMQFDGVWYDEATSALAGAGGISGGPFDQDAVIFRRARLLAEGTMYESIDYALEFDFVNSTNRESAGGTNTEGNTFNLPAPTDVWLIFRDLVCGANLQIGNLKEPIAFEHQISSRYLNFMERSYIQDLFAGPFNNGFTPGVLLFNTWAEERGTWAVGGFKNGSNIFAYDVGNGEYAADGRVTFLPIDDKDNHQLLHIGLSGSARDPDADTIRFRTRNLRNGTGNLATVFADTGSFNTNMQWLAGTEVAGIWGPLSFQAEWVGSWCEDSVSLGGTKDTVVTGTPLGTVYTNAYYAEMHYFLTGESRDYDRKRGRFTRIVPKQNFRWKNGCFQPGAWQIAFRYGAADLRDGALNGGLLQEYVVGINWFLNPNLKVQWNYVCQERDSAIDGVSDGLIHGFGMRLAHDF
jgi:phosphate-selective porin OprO/OprP